MVDNISGYGIQSYQQVKKEKSDSKLANAAGTVAGLATGIGISGGINVAAGSKLLSNYQSISDTVELNKVNQAAKEMINEHGLNQQGIKTRFIDSSNTRQVSANGKNIASALEKAAYGRLDNIKNNKFVPQFIKNLLDKESVKNGISINVNSKANRLAQGSFYIPETKVAQAAKDKAMDVFHEVGHAVNHNGKYAKFFKLRGLVPLATATMLFTSLLHKNSKSEDPEKSFFTKTKDFVKNNIGKLTLLGFAPILIDEGLASKRGLDFMKKCGKFDNAAINIAKRRLGFGFATYVVGAVGAALAAKAGVMIKDKISGEK